MLKSDIGILLPLVNESIRSAGAGVGRTSPMVVSYLIQHLLWKNFVPLSVVITAAGEGVLADCHL